MGIQPTFPDTLRALSIAGPYAYRIATGEKQSEGRSWSTRFRGLVLLHVSTGKDFGEPQSKEMVSAIIGAAEMYDCIPSESHDGHYHHLMKNPILFKQYIPNVSGARNYWSPKTPEHIKAFNQAWQQIEVQQPHAVFKIHYKDGIISVSNSRTSNYFQVKDAGVWQTLAPRLQGEEIALTKLEYADLYRSRLA
ncbi:MULTISPECIES: hypothetical protein [Cyanophyceae]|uniref:ASCH domain-containing protein n=1 Tax=Stenomitos frigidus AS-A4 TaxID=2933935 RepID=A0ABV0KKE5_9CYAN|nr:hypothetical protein [Phormidium sp. FACHB-592]